MKWRSKHSIIYTYAHTPPSKHIKHYAHIQKFWRNNRNYHFDVSKAKKKKFVFAFDTSNRTTQCLTARATDTDTHTHSVCVNPEKRIVLPYVCETAMAFDKRWTKFYIWNHWEVVLYEQILLSIDCVLCAPVFHVHVHFVCSYYTNHYIDRTNRLIVWWQCEQAMCMLHVEWHCIQHTERYKIEYTHHGEQYGATCFIVCSEQKMSITVIKSEASINFCKQIYFVWLALNGTVLREWMNKRTAVCIKH